MFLLVNTFHVNITNPGTAKIACTTIADRCHWARLRTGLDIVDVARAANLSSATVSKVENSRQIPILVTIWALAEVLKQPIWFLGCYELLPEDTLGQHIRKACLYHALTKKEFAERLELMRRQFGYGKGIYVG